MRLLDEIRQLVTALVAQEGERRSGGGWWREPLLAASKVDDRFLELRKMAAPDHLMPWDLLPTARSVIVYFLPFRVSLAKENRPGDLPCRDWGLAYVDTNRLIGDLAAAIGTFLESHGFSCALTPPTHNFDPVRLLSLWSHKHLGFLCGLGRFGHNAQLITQAGCAGRLGSLVTDADLGDNLQSHGQEACLHKAGKRCLKCVSRCPVGALGPMGLDRERCWERLKENKRAAPSLSGLPDTTHVCGKCVVILPCSFHDPVGRTRTHSPLH